jgi:hypothetical protein
MRRLFFPVLIVAGIAACSAPAKQDAAVAADPKAPATEPAVISVPLNVPTPVVESPDTPTSSLIPADAQQRVFVLSAGYGLVTAMMVNSDERMLSGMYMPTAVLHVPDTTITGNTGIARKLSALARAKSLSDFQRTSQGMRVIDDSTLADTGTYVMTLKRLSNSTTEEHGRYETTWRARKDRTKWVITEDRILPGKTVAKKR